eukprot:PhM_4_TR14570/c0_g1_i1/m.102741
MSESAFQSRHVHTAEERQRVARFVLSLGGNGVAAIAKQLSSPSDHIIARAVYEGSEVIGAVVLEKEDVETAATHTKIGNNLNSASTPAEGGLFVNSSAAIVWCGFVKRFTTTELPAELLRQTVTSMYVSHGIETVTCARAETSESYLYSRYLLRRCGFFQRNKVMVCSVGSRSGSQSIAATSPRSASPASSATKDSDVSAAKRRKTSASSLVQRHQPPSPPVTTTRTASSSLTSFCFSTIDIRAVLKKSNVRIEHMDPSRHKRAWGNLVASACDFTAGAPDLSRDTEKCAFRLICVDNDNGDVVAVIAFDIGWVMFVGVDVRRRGTGLGALLVTVAMDISRTCGGSYLGLRCLTKKVVTFYERLGFIVAPSADPKDAALDRKAPRMLRRLWPLERYFTLPIESIVAVTHPANVSSAAAS